MILVNKLKKLIRNRYKRGKNVKSKYKKLGRKGMNIKTNLLYKIKFKHQQLINMDSPQNIEQEGVLQEQKLERLDDKQQNEQELKAAQASRRSRKDIQGRDFVCGCGKKYLSYPALYTHIKTKHDGRQPQGTMKYSTTAPAKKTKTKLEQQHISYLISLVKREDIKLLDLFSNKFIGTTPVSARLKSKILEKQIPDTYHTMLKSTSSPLKLNKQSSLQQHLVAWLIGVGEFLTEKLHDQYQWFARTVRECYYQMGNQVYNKCFSKKDGGLCYVPNFRVQKVKYFPLICDFYIRFFLPYEYSQLNTNLMQLILTDFCHWLNSRRCTFIEIVLNKEYKLNDSQKIEQQLKVDKEKKCLDDEDKSHRSEAEYGDSEIRQHNKYSAQEKEAKLFEQHNDDLLKQEPINIMSQDPKRLKLQNQQQKGEKDSFITPAEEQVNLFEKQDGQVKSEQVVNESQKNSNIKFNHNWSLQPEAAASQSSQQIPQQQPQPIIHQQKFQSDVPQYEHEVENSKEEARSEKI